MNGGSPSTEFVVTGNTCPAGGVPAAAGSNTCTISVEVTAGGTGARTATLGVTATPGGTPTALNLTASGVNQAVLQLLPATQMFNANAGQTQSQTFTLTNTATAPAVVSGVPSIMITAGADYTIPAGMNACTAGVPVGTPCTFAVLFSPTTEQLPSESGTLSVTATPGATTALTSSLTGVAPGMSVTPTSFGFGGVTEGQSSASPTTFTIANDMAVATAALGTASIVPGSGTVMADFSIMTNNCTGIMLAPSGSANDTCTILVNFTPQTGNPTGARSAQVNVAAAAPGGSVSFTLSGTAN
jgi:hypothetical protein